MNAIARRKKSHQTPSFPIQSIITDTVSFFVQARDLSKIRVKRDDLDTLTEVWTGPQIYEDTFVPTFGSVHPDYNLMTVISTNVRHQEAGMSEVTLNYHGKLANGGANGYTSVPTVNKYWQEGEVTFQVNSSAGESAVFQTSTGPFVWSYSEVGITSFARRYTGRCVELAYITNRVPTGEATQIGLAQGFLGFQNVWDTMTGFQAGQQITGGGTIEQMVCTDVRVEDTADGWWHVTETYQSRMFPGPIGWEHPPPQMSTSVTLTGAPISEDNTDQTQGQDQNVITNAGGSTGAGSTTGDSYGAAQAQAVANNYTLPTSAAGSVGDSVAAQTGMDPAWASAASGAADSVTSASYSLASGVADGGSSMDPSLTTALLSAQYNW